MAYQKPLDARLSGFRAQDRAGGGRRSIERAKPYLYLLPAILPIAVWVYWPLIQTVRLSFYEWNLLPTRPKLFVGWDNYRSVLTLPDMGIALRNTVLYVVGLVPFSVLLPLALAIFVSDITGRLRGLYRVVIFTPVVMAPVVVAVIWRWILHPLQGLLYVTFLAPFDIAPVSWFRDQRLALAAVIGITAWKLLGFSFLIFSAGLTNVSREYLEAARVDGASYWQTVRDITLPLLTPTIAFIMLMTVLLASQWVFPIINVLTQGGSQDATTNIYYLLWEYGFRTFNVGWSAAAAVMFFAAFGFLAGGLVRLIDRYAIYES